MVLPSLDGANDVPGRQNAVLAIGSSEKRSGADWGQLPLRSVTDHGRVSAYEIGQDPWRSLGIQLVLLEDAGPCKVARNFGPAGGHDCGFSGHGGFSCVR